MNNTILIIVLSIILINFFDNKSLYIIIIFTILYFIYNNYQDIKDIKNIKDIKDIKDINKIGIISEEKEDLNLNSTEIKDKKHINYSSDIETILKKIVKYSKYNINDYNTGLKYLNEFLDNIKILENKNLKHSKHYIENAKLYLKKSINHFQYITTTMNDSNHLDKMKYDDYRSMKKSNKLSNLIKELYIICNNKLYNITEKYNNIFDKNPINYNSNINIDEPDAFNNINLYEIY